MQNKSIYCSFLISVLLFSLFSCYSESRLSSFEYNPELSEVNSDTCIVIFYNSSNEEFYSNIGIIDVRINNQFLSKLLMNDYLTATVPKGGNKLFLEHLDVRFFSSVHDLTLENDTNHVMIKTRPFWHKAKIIDGPPKKFRIKDMDNKENMDPENKKSKKKKEKKQKEKKPIEKKQENKKSNKKKKGDKTPKEKKEKTSKKKNIDNKEVKEKKTKEKKEKKEKNPKKEKAPKEKKEKKNP
jgi:hypothetical protein